MPRAIDLSTVTPQRAAALLRARESKRREYIRKKEIISQRNKAWQIKNKEWVAETHREWREQNKQRTSDTTHASYMRNRDVCLERSAKAQKELADSVVKGVFCCRTGLSNKDVPAELVPVIRLSILIKRELKSKRKQT